MLCAACPFRLKFVCALILSTRCRVQKLLQVHERNRHSDFILILVREMLKKRQDVKVILMSATISADTFTSYFNDCARFHVQGFTFEVKDYYLDAVLKMAGCDDS